MAPSSILDKHLALFDIPANDFPTTEYPDKIQMWLPGCVSRTENEEAITWYSYNFKRQLIWTVQKIKETGEYHELDYTYDLKGKLTKSSYQKEEAETSFFEKYYYDNNGRIGLISSSSDGVYYDVKVRNEYYDHGPLRRMELDGRLQGIDYVYTVNGLLKCINSAELSDRDPGKDGYQGGHMNFAKDVFGTTLDYYLDDYVREGTEIQTWTAYDGLLPVCRYDGLISAARSQIDESGLGISPAGLATFGNQQQTVYSYKYDELKQLTDADFGVVSAEGEQNVLGLANGSAPTFDFLSDFKVSGISYDLNGNIKNLSRNGNEIGGYEMDEMSYTYRPLTNQLLGVEDIVSSTNYSTDFNSTGVFPIDESSYPTDWEYSEAIELGLEASEFNYQYNAIGQLVADLSRGIFIKYSEAGNIKGIYHDELFTQPWIKYKYDDKNQRIKKEVYNEFLELVEEIWYISSSGGGIVSQVQITHDESETTTRTTYTAAGGNGYFLLESDKYRYNIRDNLGSVRVVIEGEKDEYGNVIILEAHDYYPGGMPIPDRTFILENDLAQGYMGQQQEEELNWVNFDLRTLDYTLLRWMTPDPFLQYWSPYMSMGNDWINRVDPSGGSDAISLDELLLAGANSSLSPAFDNWSSYHAWKSDPLQQSTNQTAPWLIDAQRRNGFSAEALSNLKERRLRSCASPSVRGYMQRGGIWAYDYKNASITLLGYYNGGVNLFVYFMGSHLDANNHYSNANQFAATVTDENGGVVSTSIRLQKCTELGYTSLTAEELRLKNKKLVDDVFKAWDNMEMVVVGEFLAVTGVMAADAAVAHFGRQVVMNYIKEEVQETVIEEVTGVGVNPKDIIDAAKAGKHYVYHSLNGDVTQYVGITNNFARRKAEHLREKGIHIDPLMKDLSYSDARAVEQVLIEIHGLGKDGGSLLNMINSISSKNPSYGSQLERGYELLRSIGYEY